MNLRRRKKKWYIFLSKNNSLNIIQKPMDGGLWMVYEKRRLCALKYLKDFFFYFPLLKWKIFRDHVVIKKIQEKNNVRKLDKSR
jgi:hypothetical protein